MAQKTIPQLKGQFANNKFVDQEDFGDVFDSYIHKSTKVPQTQILGLNDELNKLEQEKASKEDLQNVTAGLVPMGNALDMADLNTKPKRNNDSYFVLDQLDENGDPYIFRYDAELADWINTKQVVYKNVAKKEDLQEKETANNPFVPTMSGSDVMPIEQWRSFILGLEIGENYNPNLYYSPAIIDPLDGANVSVNIYSSPNPKGGVVWERIVQFIIPTQNKGIQFHEVGQNRIVVDTRFIPAERIEAQNYNIAGLSPTVFVQGNSPYIEGYKQNNLLKQSFTGNKMSLGLGWLPTEGYWQRNGTYFEFAGYSSTTPIPVVKGKYYCIFSLLTSIMSVVSVDANGNPKGVIRTGDVPFSAGHNAGVNIIYIPSDSDITHISFSNPTNTKGLAYITEVNSNFVVDIYKTLKNFDADIVNLIGETSENSRNVRIQNQYFLGNRNANLIKSWLETRGYWDRTGVFKDFATWETTTPIEVNKGRYYMILSTMHANIGFASVDSEGNFKKIIKTGQLNWVSGYSYGLTMVYIPSDSDITHISVSTETSNKSLAFVQEVNSNLFVEICKALGDVEKLKEQIAEMGAGAKPYDAFLPPKMYAVVGKEFNIYYDTFVLCPEYGNGHPPFLFDIDCTKGLMDKRSFRFTPSIGDIGEHDLTLRMLDNSGNIAKIYTSKLVIVDAILPTIIKLILSIGDSTSDDTGEVTKQLQINLSECDGATPLFLGTHQNEPAKNEARTGKQYNSFANGDTAYKFYFDGVDPNLDISNTFKFRNYYYDNDKNAILLIHRWIVNADGTGYAIGYHWNAFTPPTIFPATLTSMNGENPTLNITNCEKLSNYSILKDNEGEGNLNFEYYRTEILGLASDKKIDVLTMDCGINDLTGALFTDAQIANVVNNAKKLVDAFLVDNPNGKIMLCLPKSRNSDLRLTTRNMLRVNIFNYSKKVIEVFANNPSVIISQSGFAMDRFYGYPLVEQKVASRYNETLLTANNDVHPRAEGYHQVADGMTGAVLMALK
ncbi:MAG: hypothetical protein LBV43_14340 [Prevotella sp.]|jgi:hypothetical protein|nr:hypothetical protein [Prevotella sp.]